MKLRTPAGCLVLLATLAGRLAAHDYWLEPARFYGAPGETVALKLFVGEDLRPEEEREFVAARIREFAVFTSSGRTDLRTASGEGAKPFARVGLSGAGTHLVVLQRNPATITLEPAKFLAYLREEGLDSVVADRARRGETDRPGRERYARFLKCYLRAGNQPEASVPRAELRLDITPELRLDRPMRAGDELRVHILFDGAPLPAAVFAATRGPGGQAVTQQLTTDEQGAAVVKLTAPGLWLVRLVHMQRAPAGDVEADWESFWAACTFGVQ